jgi:type IV pilus assembly protein PilW
MKNIAYTQRGLSLVELMVSITIGLFILAAMTTLFSNQVKSRAELDKSNRMLDNGRYALEILSDNLRAAGYYGSYAPSGTPVATIDPCDVAQITSNSDVLLLHVQGYNAAGASSAISSLPASCGFSYTAGGVNTLKPGSDILVLRRASTAAPVAAASAVANTLYLQTSNCTTDLSSYRVAPGTADFSALHNKDCATTASLRPFLVQVYFVASNNNPNDGIPTLKRRELDPVSGAFVTTPLVEGIEYMQVDYGLDADANGSADSYIAAPLLADWPNIVSVRLNIIARNNELSAAYTDTKTYTLGSAGTFGPFYDAYKRHAYTEVVRLNNPSGRRELP